MKFYSTNRSSPSVSAKEAILQGLAPDGGLYMPEQVPTLPNGFIEDLGSRTLPEIGFEIAKGFLAEEIPGEELRTLVAEAVNFDAPLHFLEPRTAILELFHGPTFAFKDFGARFMARVMSHFRRNEENPLTILVATSGDTGGAVAHGFHNVEGIRVVILYPSGKVSPLQEQQLTTLGGNITALEVRGTFDDCQRMVKDIFVDTQVGEHLQLTSANSINIARLIPQSFYYLHTAAQLCRSFGSLPPMVFSIPSGNFGNLTAGLFAKGYGLPVERFLAACNANDTVVRYLESGRYSPKASVQTLSNAMDVGNPSNFARMKELYRDSRKTMASDILAATYSDAQTLSTIKSVFETTSYLLDPHTAVGYLGLADYSRLSPETVGIVLATAHPAKFEDVIDQVLPGHVEMPPTLGELLSKEKESIEVSTKSSELKEFLLSLP